MLWLNIFNADDDCRQSSKSPREVFEKKPLRTNRRTIKKENEVYIKCRTNRFSDAFAVKKGTKEGRKKERKTSGGSDI